MLPSLIFLTFISATGLLLYIKKNIESTYLSVLIAFGAGTMLTVSLIHIFPESFEQTHNAVYAFLAGFVVIYLIEEIFFRHREYRTHHDHVHEDPHSHTHHVALMTFFGILLHTIIDGVSIRAGVGLSTEIGYTIFLSVIVHQIPVSLTLGAILRESNITKSTQIILIGIFILAVPIGFIVSDFFFTNVAQKFMGLIAAFAGGSLLYIATTDLMPVIHSNTKHKYLSISAFLLGVTIISVFALYSHDAHKFLTQDTRKTFIIQKD